MQTRPNEPVGQLLQRSRAIALLLSLTPCLLAFNPPPSPTVLNQCMALGLWGTCLVAVSPMVDRATLAWVWPLLVAGALMLLDIGAVVVAGHLPLPIALDAAAVIAAAVLVGLGGAALQSRHDAVPLCAAFMGGLMLVGVISALIAFVQVFVPALADGDWLARTTLPGRGVGNLRQPNHLASLLLWAAMAVVALLELRLLSRVVAGALFVLLLAAVALSGSRTGLAGALLLAGWGLVDRRLSPASRALLWAAPVVAWLAWAVLAWGPGPVHSSAIEERFVRTLGGDASSSRLAIWKNAAAMLAAEPWTGVGYGEFNLAWTLWAFPDRPTAFFDHSHNLPLQLLVEFGVPLGSTVIALLLLGAAQACRRAWRSAGEVGALQRVMAMMVVMIGWHSLLEYPLWYAYFLLPAAFAWGFALTEGAGTAARASARGGHSIAGLGLALVLGAAAAVIDYHRIAAIYDPPEHAAPLEERIHRGQRSPLFGHHADYAAATAFGPPEAPLQAWQELAFRRAPHHLLDIRLMIAWSQALAAQGEVDKARWLAARIREFRNPAADEFFEPCKDPAQAAQAFQCQAPQSVYHWREFVSG